MKYFFWLFFLIGSSLTAQESDSLAIPVEEIAEPVTDEADPYYDEEMSPYTPPAAKPVPLRTLEKKQWAEASSGLDYSKDVPPPQDPPKPPADPTSSVNWSAFFSWLGQGLQVLAVIAAILAIAYGIYHTLNAPRNRQIARDGVEITVENVEQYLHESDLDRFLREALEAGNFPLAIRLYYLQVIKQLSESGAIRWSREKTNREYLRETRNHRSGEAFRNATRIYERIWYGNQPLDASAYKNLEPSFKNLLSTL